MHKTSGSTSGRFASLRADPEKMLMGKPGQWRLRKDRSKVQDSHDGSIEGEVRRMIDRGCKQIHLDLDKNDNTWHIEATFYERSR
jgi:hypothetical protein